MKIIKKAKIKPVTCKVCGCVFIPDKKELSYDFSSGLAHALKTTVNCPTCKFENNVKFEVKA